MRQFLRVFINILSKKENKEIDIRKKSLMRLTVDVDWRNDKKETNPASTIDRFFCHSDFRLRVPLKVTGWMLNQLTIRSTLIQYSKF